MAVVRAITTLLTMRDRSVVKSSVIASTKYSCSGSFDRLAKGSTTIERRGAGFGAFAEGAPPGAFAESRGQTHQAPAPAPRTTMRPAAIKTIHGRRPRVDAACRSCTGTSGRAAN